MLATTTLSAAELAQSAQRIKLLRRAATEHAVEIGKELLAVKERLPHGSFVKWVEKACDFKIRTAQDLMKLARAAGSNEELVALMVPSTLRAYLAKSTPPAVRTSILKRLENGDRVSRSQLHLEVVGSDKRSSTTTGRREAQGTGSSPISFVRCEEPQADVDSDRPRALAELLLSRLSPQDYELVMDGMNWEVWNRILVWMRAARIVDNERVSLGQAISRADARLVDSHC